MARRCVVQVIAPSRSGALLSAATVRRATQVFEASGFEVRLSRHFFDNGPGHSAPVRARVDDLHEAFLNDNVDIVIAAIGGWSAVELLPHVDWAALANHRKILCGFSDITVLLHAFAARHLADAIFSPNFSDFAAPTEQQYTVASFMLAVNGAPVELSPGASWSSNRWYVENFRSVPRANDGLGVLRQGRATGSSFAATLSVLLLLLGTPHALDMTGTVLFIEDFVGVNVNEFRRDMHVLSMAPAFSTVRGIVLGRFHPGASIHADDLRALVETLPIPAGIPIVYNADFGHTDPKASIPLGAPVTVVAGADRAHIVISPPQPQMSEIQ